MEIGESRNIQTQNTRLYEWICNGSAVAEKRVVEYRKNGRRWKIREGKREEIGKGTEFM